MSAIGGIGGGPGDRPPIDARARLRESAQEFEALFLAQLFKEMRSSIPEGGLLESGPGQEMFTGFLDDAIALEAARRSTRGLGEALYRQLAARLNGADRTTTEP